MSEPYIAEVKMFGGNFAPVGYGFCDGQILSIAQNTALFAILGTTFGGNGQTTFGLPDMRGRVPVHQGQGPGLGNYTLGEVGGTENVTLTTNQIPNHSHTFLANSGIANSETPANTYPSSGKVYVQGAPSAPFAATAIATTGGSQPHFNMMPYTGINFIIAIEGIFPPRS